MQKSAEYVEIVQTPAKSFAENKCASCTFKQFDELLMLETPHLTFCHASVVLVRIPKSISVPDARILV